MDPWGSVLARVRSSGSSLYLTPSLALISRLQCHDNQQKYENQEDGESGSYAMAE